MLPILYWISWLKWGFWSVVYLLRTLGKQKHLWLSPFWTKLKSATFLNTSSIADVYCQNFLEFWYLSAEKYFVASICTSNIPRIMITIVHFLAVLSKYYIRVQICQLKHTNLNLGKMSRKRQRKLQGPGRNFKYSLI